MRLSLSPALLGTALIGLALTGCSFGPKVPASLLALPSTAQVQPGTARSASDGQAILIGVPGVPAELGALRIPVRTTPTEIAYVKDAQWTDAPARLFRNLLAETVTARTGRVVLEPRGANVTPGLRLGGRLQSFGLDAATRMAVVTYDASLARGKTDTVATRRFEARVPVTTEDGPTIASALTQAANQVATEVATWIGG
ncbi:ABC-type transport auxiliary lipoprotein family protein [Sphingomonas montana]|uniref:ABC-type transport auxiliary lipoprotein family protein n=1 Tax=Sphingomonas montana TaxID=1843236 RepID=UPI00096F21C0|nr:ABC-type transport auxiliary lipoprotein family protein [Sphingomonas montana]